MTLLLPCRFEAWDLDKDGYINVEEFAFTGHAKIESRSTRELFKKIDSDSKHERFKHFLILFWKRIHFVQRVMFASFKIYLSSKITEEEAIMFMVTLLITVSDCQTRFARTGKANIVLITLPITVSDCQILFSRNGKANIVMITLPITVSDCHFFPRTGKANIVILTSLITVSDCQVLITCFI